MSPETIEEEAGASLLIDASGTILGAHGEGCVEVLAGRRYLDYARAVLAGSAEERDALLGELTNLFAGTRERVERACRGADGALFRVRASRLSGSAPALFLARHTRACDEDASRLRRAWFALDHASDAVFWVGRNSRFEYVNESAARMFGYTREDLLTKSVPDLDPTISAANWPEKLKETLEGEGRRESLGRHATGRVFPIEVNVSRFFVDGREYFCTFIRDISERKKLEAQFQQAQKMEAVGRLAGGVAHDFNNLLTIINGYSELLLSRGSLEESDEALTREIRDAGVRAAGLTRQLLMFSRRHLTQPVQLDLNAVLGDMEKMLRRLIGEDVRLEVETDASVGRVKADPGQIEQVVMNLAVNARDAMPRGGRLIIRTGNASEDDLRRLASLGVPAGRYIRLSIADTGVGMDEDTLARLYEPFFTTKEPGKGTGLGLSTVYGIVRSVGGQISCASRPGEGTTFTIYLPEAAGPAPLPSARVRESAARSGHERVLVVEDDPCVRLTIRTLLERYGYDVEIAESPLEVIHRVRAADQRPRLVVSDWVMPGMAGPEFSRWVRATWPGVPVLLVSGYTDRDIQNQAGGTANGFLQKPFTPATLARKVRETIDAARLAGTPA